jgi:orotidine-5'-phosphate decarboxylase
MYKYLVIFFISFLISNSLFAEQPIETLDKRIKDTNSLVCVGLDPDINKIPESINSLKISNEDKIYKFLIEVVDITAPHASAYKIQKAFFDQFDGGHALLRKVVSYIHNNHKGILVIVDCKIGDTDNTMKAYMKNIFKDIRADGVVVNPYMGDDVLEPFMQDQSKLGIVLIQTSNPNAKVVQELTLKNGKKLWEEMLDILITRWNKNRNLIPVLSSNVGYANYSSIRKSIPQDMPILLAGVGLQGGDPQIIKQLLNNNKRGVFVNSSRGILYQYNTKDQNWKKAVLQSVVELKTILNKSREL